jgi:hypothetical protein
MNNSAAQLAPGASVKKPQVTVALLDFFIAQNDYSSSRHSALQPKSAQPGNHHTARTMPRAPKAPTPLLPTGSPEAQQQTFTQATLTGHSEAASRILLTKT